MSDTKPEASDLLIRKLDARLKRKLAQRARAHGRSMSDEAKAMLDEALEAATPPKKMGTWMRSLLPAEFRGDDFVFEVQDDVREPPDFK